MRTLLTILTIAAIVTMVTGGCLSGTFRPKNRSNCTRFKQCANGDWHNYVCPLGLLWNQDIQTCTYPYNVDPDTCRNASLAQPYLTSCVPGTLYGDKERNCSMFYDCVSGIRRPCPARTLFAEDKGMCMSKPTVNKNSCVIKKNRVCDPPGSVRGRKKCAKFQICSSEGVWSNPMLCPRKMLINTVTGECEQSAIIEINGNKCTSVFKDSTLVS